MWFCLRRCYIDLLLARCLAVVELFLAGVACSKSHTSLHNSSTAGTLHVDGVDRYIILLRYE